MSARVYILITTPDGLPFIHNMNTITLEPDEPDIERVIFSDDNTRMLVMRRIIGIIGGMGKNGRTAIPVGLYRTEDGLNLFIADDHSICLETVMHPICRFDERNLPIPLESTFPEVHLQSLPL